MTAKPDAWMPLYIGDWDSGTAHLDCEQDGAYGRLVRHYWKNGPLADDDALLCRIIRMPLTRWRKIRPSIAAFFVVADGRWTHRRVEHELASWAERKRKAIERATAGGRAKAAKNPASSTSQAVLDVCSSSSPLVGEPKEGSPHQRRQSGRAPEVAHPPVAWSGPPELRTAVVVAKGEEFARSYLDPCAWQDLPARGIVPHGPTAARKLEREARGILAIFDAIVLPIDREHAA